MFHFVCYTLQDHTLLFSFISLTLNTVYRFHFVCYILQDHTQTAYHDFGTSIFIEKVSGLCLRSEIYEHLRHFLQTRNQGHDTIDSLDSWRREM